MSAKLNVSVAYIEWTGNNEAEIRAFIERGDQTCSFSIDRTQQIIGWRTWGTKGDAWKGDYLLRFFGRVISMNPEGFRRWKKAQPRSAR